MSNLLSRFKRFKYFIHIQNIILRIATSILCGIILLLNGILKSLMICILLIVLISEKLSMCTLNEVLNHIFFRVNVESYNIIKAKKTISIFEIQEKKRKKVTIPFYLICMRHFLSMIFKLSLLLVYSLQLSRHFIIPKLETCSHMSQYFNRSTIYIC